MRARFEIARPDRKRLFEISGRRADACGGYRTAFGNGKNTYCNEWLPWLGRVRFLIITFLVMVVVIVRQLTPIQLPLHTLVSHHCLWYTLAVLYVILHRWIPQARWQAPLQMILDLVIITGVVYATGAQDSDFISLYLLAILMGSILFSGRGAFLVAGGSFVLLGSVVELAYYGLIPRTAVSIPAASRRWNPGSP